MAPAVRVQARKHTRANIFFGTRFSATCGVGVEQVSLELFDLFWSQHDFGKFANSRVDAVHDFAGTDLALEKVPAFVDPYHRSRM